MDLNFEGKRFYQKVNIDLYDIKILKVFSNTVPNPFRISECIRFYQWNKKIDKPIIVNHNGELIDGYIRYLVAKMFEITEPEVYWDLNY